MSLQSQFGWLQMGRGGARWLALVIGTLLMGPTVATSQSSALPWETSPDGGGPQLDAADLLNAFGIDDSVWAQFEDGQDIGPAEAAALQRILFRLPQLPRAVLEAETSVGQGTFQDAQPGELVVIRGMARRVQRFVVPDTSPLRFEYRQYYRVEVEQDAPAAAVVLWTRRAPAAWTAPEMEPQPIRAAGVFLKRGEAASAHVASARIAWFPEQASESPPVNANDVYLAARGMDLALFDDVRGRNRQPMRGEDRECFYQLLAAVRDGLSDAPVQQFQIGPLLKNPELHHGEIVAVRGRVQRITKVLVDDDDISRRVGLAEYYQLDAFIPLSDQIIKFRTEEADADSPTFSDSYPVTICVAQLPPELTEGENLRIEIRMHAAFFKLWSYRSRYADSFGGRPQISPMLIGAAPSVVRAEPAQDRVTMLVLGGIFLALLAAIWLVIWRAGQGDRKFANQVLKRARENNL